MDTYDVAVIGAGPGGYVCAFRAAQLGLRVALIEKRPTLGGTCLNLGCIPSKALLYSSEQLVFARDHAAAHGIRTGAVSPDIGAILRRKDAVVSRLVGGVAALAKARKVAVLAGEASFASPTALSIRGPGGAVSISAKNFVIATGSVPMQLHGNRSRRDDKILGRDGDGPARAPDRQRGWRGERGLAREDGDLSRLRERGHSADEPGHDGVLAPEDRANVGGNGARPNAMRRGMVPGEHELLRRIEEGLARDAAQVQAGAAQGRPLLDQRHPEPELRGAERAHVSARARPDDRNVIRVHEGAPVRCPAGGARDPRSPASP